MPVVARSEWVPSQAEFDLFAEISGDDNPIHVDPAFAACTRFGRTVSHGMLIYSKLWGLLAAAVPGARQVSQVMMFPNPCYAGDIVDLEIINIAGKLYRVGAVRRGDGAELLTGETEIA